MEPKNEIILRPHQIEVVRQADEYIARKINHLLLYSDFGLGKTYMALSIIEKYAKVGDRVLVICGATKIEDWEDALEKYNLNDVSVVSMDTIWRRPFDYYEHVIIDESQFLKDGTSKRANFILLHHIKAKYLVMLTGAPYYNWEHAYGQLKALKPDINYKEFKDKYLIMALNRQYERPFMECVGYKNIDELINDFKNNGTICMSYEDAMKFSPELSSLMSKNIKLIDVKQSQEAKKFKKDRLLKTEKTKYLDEIEYIGETPIAVFHAEMRLNGAHNEDKIKELEYYLNEANSERVVIFYRYGVDFEVLKQIAKKLNRTVSYINGEGIDLTEYKNKVLDVTGKDVNNTLVLCQWRAGAIGHNLQLAHTTISFSLTNEVELFDQHFARTNRIGQEQICNYIFLLSPLEKKIYEQLINGLDFTMELYKMLI